MTGEPTLAERAGAAGLSPQEAFVCLLIAGARADGSVSPHEANQIEHVVASMRLFRGSTYEARQAMFANAAGRFKDQGAGQVIRTASAALPKELGRTGFAQVVDLMLSDGRLTANEQRFAEEVRALLDVDRETAAKIVDVLTIKNAG